jgi:hypothetical protein
MSLEGAIVKKSLLVYVLLGLGVSYPATPQADYKRVSVCEVLAEPRKHHLQHVAIDADLFIARPHGVVLLDKRCSEKGLALDFPRQDEDRSVSNLERLIRNGEWPMESTGRFSGTITRDSKTKRPVLSLSSVVNLKPKGGPTTQPDVTNPIAREKSLPPERSYTAPPKPQ